MAENEIQEVIVGIFKAKDVFSDISFDQDFFDLGASSLTVVDLQIQVEKALGLTVPTPKLMENPTINGWVSAYSA